MEKLSAGKEEFITEMTSPMEAFSYTVTSVRLGRRNGVELGLVAMLNKMV